MTRKKNPKRFHQQRNNGSKKNDQSPFSLLSPDAERQKFLLNSAGRTPVKTPNSFYSESRRKNQQTPSNDLFHTPFKMDDLDNLFSPRPVPKIPKLKLDFDMPENDSDKEDFATTISEPIVKQLSEECNNVISTRLENRTSELNEESKIKINEYESGYDSNSPTNKNLSTFFDEEKFSMVQKLEVNNNHENRISCAIKSQTDFLIVPDCREKLSEKIVSLTPKKYYYNIFEQNSRFILFRQSMLIIRKLTIPFPKVTEICSWISIKFCDFLKQIFIQGPKNLISRIVSQSNCTASVENKNFNQILSVIKCENDKNLMVFSATVTNFSERLNQVQISSEISIKTLTKEVTILRDANEKLVQNSSVLVEELKNLHETLKNMQMTFKSSLPLPPSSLTQNVSSSIPPPPPPPPPFPTSSIPFIPPPPPPLPKSPFSRQNTPTPKSSKKHKKKTPAKKSSSTSSTRPSITVEDLLKVTLKKAPNNSKENTRRNSFPIQKGPLVSLDMLQNVKLRSSRNRPSDLKTKSSPRNRSVALNNQSKSSPKMSPTSSKSENPLNRILKNVDLNIPQRRKSFLC
ncbi:arp2/3 complex-activating protein rickA-like [Leptopilina heterotoma]|uniref:arp2/3 complex-activating protein rickA-like n=1 Tax=Leptopilina heterotoma TaxID=63436 RepID=UPI001CA8521D|nr:arp2/3 complex-activating protein rickA-like [Leptopilina heterotoma]